MIGRTQTSVDCAYQQWMEAHQRRGRRQHESFVWLISSLVAVFAAYGNDYRVVFGISGLARLVYLFNPPGPSICGILGQR